MKSSAMSIMSSAMSIKVLSLLPSSVVLKHAWTMHQRKGRSFCLVPRSHYPARPKRFESRGPSENVFCARSPRIRHRSELTESAWENAVQGLAPCLYMVEHLKVIMNGMYPGRTKTRKWRVSALQDYYQWLIFSLRKI